MKAIVFEAERTGYTIGQIDRPMTVSDLMCILEDFDDDDIVILSHDNGYSFGTVSNPTEYEHNEETNEWEAQA